MTNLSVRYERYLKEPFPRRLGALAANLARVASFAKSIENLKLIESLLEESEYFIEWTAHEIPEHLRSRLIELQIQLAVCAYRLRTGKNEINAFLEEFKKHSDELLTVSGLTT